MITQSGCFGQSRTPDPIDDINEAAEAMAGIIDSANQQTPTDASGAAMPALAVLVGQYAKRVRLLTWAVVIMAVVIVMREID
ncbi:MAG: hypothetical protein IJQ83_07340 [Bacteroidales bacterium]|nr:hypothetical protein [Bacteroidales bacterium]